MNSILLVYHKEAVSKVKCREQIVSEIVILNAVKDLFFKYLDASLRSA